MTLKEGLSQDITLIKEVEELRLKQKLLIETLKNQEAQQKNANELAMISKLDFLVKLFTDATTTEEEEETPKKSQELEKLEILSKTFQEYKTQTDKKLDELLKEIKSLKSNKGDSLPPPPTFVKKDEPVAKPVSSEEKEPPIPHFKKKNK